MKSEHLQQCIIIVLVFYFLFSIFYKCPCTRRTLEGMVPNIDIDIPDIDINRLSVHSNKEASDDYQPLMVSPIKDVPSMADSDSSSKKKIMDNKRIRLVGGAKDR